MRSFVFGLLVVLTSSAEANPFVVKEYPWTTAVPSLEIAPDTVSTPLKIRSEDLYISPAKVRARYVIANDTDKTIHVKIAFPLWEIDTDEYWPYTTNYSGKREWKAGIGTHTDDPINYIDLKAASGGHTLTAQGHQRAYLLTSRGREDVTTEITVAGLPLLLVGPTKAIDQLPETTRRHLFDRHILGGGQDDYNLKPGAYPRSYRPRWYVNTSFTWEQTFPAHGMTPLDVSYQPITGGTVAYVPSEKEISSEKKLTASAGGHV